jgi:MFS family permease
VIRALGHRNFRLYFLGQIVSLVGTWMQQVAMGWLVYRLTGSVLLLGVVGFASQVPILVFAPFGGLWSDRFNRRHLLLLTQTLSMIQALILAGLTLTHLVQVWHLVAMALMLGLINAVDAPARQSFVVQLVGSREDLPNAIALNSFTINSTRLLGPTVAGFVVSLFGEGVCFLFNGLSYLGVIWVLATIRVADAPRLRHSMVEGLKQGFAYAFGFPPIRALLLLMATLSFAATPYIVLMPVYAKQVFHGDASTLGLLMGASGLGALIGTFYLASRKTVVGLGRVITGAVFCAGGGLMAFAFSSSLWAGLPTLALVGFGIIAAAASSNTVIQTVVKEHFRGRTMSLFTMSFLGMAPLGSLAAGSLAHRIGTPETLFLGGLTSILAGIVFARQLPALREQVRPIYLEMGLLGNGQAQADDDPDRGESAGRRTTMQ